MRTSTRESLQCFIVFLQLGKDCAPKKKRAMGINRYSWIDDHSDHSPIWASCPSFWPWRVWMHLESWKLFGQQRIGQNVVILSGPLELARLWAYNLEREVFSCSRVRVWQRVVVGKIRDLLHGADQLTVCAASTLIIAEHEYQPFTGHSSDHLRHGQVQVRACHCNLAKLSAGISSWEAQQNRHVALATKYYPFGTLTWKNAHL